MKRFHAFGPVFPLLLLVGMSASGQDMRLAQVLIDGEGWEEVAAGMKFTEGPAVDAEGNLFFTDVPNSKIYKLDANGNRTLFVGDSQRTNGLMFGPDGKLYGCQGGTKSVVAFDSEGKATTVAEAIAVNDLVVARTGDIYVTEPSEHRVWHIDPKGNKRVVADGIERPNGIILWPGQGTLVVADTRTEHLWTFRIEPDGSLAHKEGYYTLRMVDGKNGSGADGMTVDSAGRLYVASYAGLQMFDPTGRMGGVILKPQNAFLSNVVFAGPKLDTLYVTCADKVFRRKTKTTGVRFATAAD